MKNNISLLIAGLVTCFAWYHGIAQEDSEPIKNNFYQFKLSEHKPEFFRKKLFGADRAIEYSSIFHYGETPFIWSIRESVDGDFLSILTIIKKDFNEKDKDYILNYQNNKYSRTDRDPFWEMKPDSLCMEFGLPIGHNLHKLTSDSSRLIFDIDYKGKKNGIIGKKNKQLTTFIDLRKNQYFGSYSGGMGGIVPLFFEHKRKYDDNLDTLKKRHYAIIKNYKSIESNRHDEMVEKYIEMEKWFPRQKIDRTAPNIRPQNNIRRPVPPPADGPP